MKKLITMAVATLLTAGTAVFASGKPPVTMPQKQFDYQLSFSKIVVDDDIDLQLKEGSVKTIDLEGKDKDVENVAWKIKNDVLYIQSKRGSLKEKVKVIVSVNHLKELVIMGASMVKSEGALLSPTLYVHVDSESYVAIKSTGRIFIVSNPGTELQVEKMLGDVQIGK